MKFQKGLADLVTMNWERFNRKVAERVAELDNALLNTDLRIEVIFVTMGTPQVASAVAGHMDDCIATLNDPTEVALFTYLNQGAVYKLLVDDTLSAQIDLTVELSDWDAWKVRRTLCTCESIDKAPAGGTERRQGTFGLKGVSIVNGAQTVGTLARALRAGKQQELDAVRVMVRFISLESAPEDFGKRVTREKPPIPGVFLGGQGRDRTGDLPLFRRTLVPTELPGRKAPGVRRARAPCLATLTGLEPATSAVTGRRANQLRHRALLYYPLRVAASRVPPTGFEPALPP